MRQIYDEELKYEFRVMGYQHGNEIIDIDSKLIGLWAELKNMSYNIEYGGFISSKNRLIVIAKNCLDNYFDFHDVRFVPEECLLFCPTNQMAAFKYVDKRSKMISPYDIPIRYSFETYLGKHLSEYWPYFVKICIDRRDAKSAVPSYIHELAHTQLDSINGIIVNYHNCEVLPIFMEIVSSLLLDFTGNLFRNVQLYRYKNLLMCLEHLKKCHEASLTELDATTYIVSTLKAENLICQYINGDNKTKERILFGIQRVFDGIETVEDFLDRFNVSFENSKDNRLIRCLRV